MTKYDNTNRGALFKNDKGDNPKRPDYRGKLDVGGVEYLISGWIMESKKGEKFMSLKVEVKEEKPAPEKPAPAKQADIDDTIPFN